ncbi:MAG: UDP-3-O-(3-hydroxymyristoyl)glucosamine N-acyltransferase [bacterium]|nr:UDP-3-O-(3-hydroxymyristoyl)glucosamine N-acyltransferase [bacterium]
MIKDLGEIAKILEGELIGDKDIQIGNAASIEDAKSEDITFVTDRKNLIETQASCIIVPKDIDKWKKPIIRVANPRLAFAKVLEIFKPLSKIPSGIHPTSILGEGVTFGKEVTIGAHVVIGKDVHIGDNVVIYPLVYIGSEVEIGDDSIIYPQVSLMDRVKIGKRVIIHSGSVIGSDGFGYVEIDKTHHKIPQIGSVRIEDSVEIGANVCIDRATTGWTTIGKGTKIDNLVQIAHNVKIGENCILTGQVGISGSVRIENGVIFGGQSGVADHLTVGENVIVAAKAGITKNIERNVRVAGFPAKPLQEERKIKASISRLPRLFEKVRSLEKEIERLKKKGEVGNKL